jgi:L-ascorbate metabolism protein UlaG (beta-lactamase superfamily)
MPVEVQRFEFSEPLAQRLAGASEIPLALYWLGQAGFVIKAGGKCLVVDPYLSDSLAGKYRGKRFPHERMMPAPVTPAGLGSVDLVLCTHSHTDHMDPQTLAPLAGANPGLRFVVPEAARDEARDRIGVDDDRLWLLDAGRSVSPLPGITVTAFRAAHEELETDSEGRYRFLGYVIEVSGIRIVHSGDTVPFSGLSDEIAAHVPDLALFPVNGRSELLKSAGVPGNLRLDEAIDLCTASGIPAMIAHHYGMFSFNTIPAEIIDRRAIDRELPIWMMRARTQVEYRVRIT